MFRIRLFISKNRKTAPTATAKVMMKPIVPGELYVSSATGVGIVARKFRPLRKFTAQVSHQCLSLMG